MNTRSKRTTAFLAAVIMSCGVIGHYPVCTQKADAAAPSVRHFADSVLPLLPAQSDTVFESLCFNKDSHQLFRDGESVSENSISGFRIIDGELQIAASETVRAGETPSQDYIPLEEAASLIGLETYETADSVYVSEPFRSGTLIVKSDTLPDTMGASELGSGWNDLHVLQYPTAADAYAAYQAFQEQDEILFAEPNRIYHIADAETSADSDYEFPAANWGWKAIGADSFLTQFAESGLSAPEIVVAVIDTGIYSEHNWFQNRIAEGGASFVDENNGSYDDLHGHGTHCAGIICGMTPDHVKILPLKALNRIGYGDTLGIFCAMLYAAEQDADVVSMSLGGAGCSPMFEEAVRELKAKQIPCVVAAGNESADAKYSSPANAPDVITVSSVTLYESFWEQEEEPDKRSEHDLKLSGFSNFGDIIDFAAPGDMIDSASTVSPNETINMSGTSMATPHVAGCVADILSVQPDYTIDEIYECLKENALDLGDPGFDPQFGWGIVNLAALDYTQSDLLRPEASAGSGIYDEVFSVTLSTPEPDAEIRYTLDGSIPEADTGILYQGEEILIDNTMILNAVSVKNGERSGNARWHYTFFQPPPVMDMESGDYWEDIIVSLAEPSPYDIYYTTDGSDPTAENGTLYTEPIHIMETTLLKAAVVIGNYAGKPSTYYYQINGVHSDLIFECKDGVLTKYRGVDDNLDLNEYFGADEITKIGDHAFEKNENLIVLTLPESVKTIGKNAFAFCDSLARVKAPGVETIETNGFKWAGNILSLDMPKLKYVGDYAFEAALGDDEDDIVIPTDNQIREIGYGAFQSCDFHQIELPNLQKIGEDAFSYCYTLERVKLPANITRLPKRAFLNCERLKTLDAPGVTELDDYALSLGRDFQSSMVDCSIDLAKLTAVGTHALSMYRSMPMDRVSFDALAQISTNAFADFPATELRFPALKTIPSMAFWDAPCSVVYLEQAEKLEKDALTPNPNWGHHITYVFGDHVSAYQDQPLSTDCKAIAVAAPADSPMKQFAKIAGTPFYTTPDIFVPEGFTDIRQFEPVALNDCIPLAFGCKIVFSAADADSENAQPIFTDETGTKSYLDTSVPGTVTLRAALVDENDTVLTTKTLTFDIEPIDSKEIITKVGPLIFEWEQGYVQKVEPDSIWAPPDVSAEYVYQFAPEEDGDYYILPATMETTVSVYDKRGVCIRHTKSWGYSGDLECNAVALKAGEVYKIAARTTSYFALNRLFASILISDHAPEEAIDNDYRFEQDTFCYPKDANDFDMHTLTVRSYDTDWETNEYRKLTEGTDYELVSIAKNDNQKVFALGTGKYFGVIETSVCFYEDYTLGETINLPEIQPRQTLCYHLKTPETDGKYLFGLNFSDAFLDEFTAGRKTGDLFACMLDLTLLDSEMHYVYPDLTGAHLCPENQYTLSSGQDYYVTINYFTVNSNINVPYAPEDTFIMYSTEFDENHWITSCEVNLFGDKRYSGEPVNFVKSVVDPDGNTLTEGKDFRVYADNKILPGDHTILVTGIGDYYGSIVGMPSIMDSELTTGPFAATSIQPNEPFRAAKNSASFELKTDHTYVCKLRKTDNSDPDADYHYVISTYDPETFSWNPVYSGTRLDEDRTMQLAPGTYRIHLAQDAADQEYILDAQVTAKGISQANVSIEPLSYTGTELTPEITLTYDGNTLTEGTDYILVYPDEPIIASGTYAMKAYGIGGFSGVKVFLAVVDEPEKAVLPEAKTGENTLSVVPGQAAVCEWIADDTSYGIALNSLHQLSLAVIEQDTQKELLDLHGCGYLYGFFETTPGKKYQISASWRNPEKTDDIVFTLLSDYTDLTACTVENTDTMVFTEQNTLPECIVKNGDTVLQKDVDYTLYYGGGNTSPGHAVVSLTGIGTCIGELQYHYYLSPALDPAAFEQFEDTTELTADTVTTKLIRNPGEIQQFSFVAPADGIYRIDRPDPYYSGVNVFVYGADQELLPMDTDTVAMKAGEKLWFFAVSDRIDLHLNVAGEYHLAVYAAEQTTLRGDLNGDGTVDRNDWSLLMQYITEDPDTQIPDAALDAADLNNDGCLDLLDANALRDAVLARMTG